ncbi:hypothetical protein, partial [Enterobacter hormaechei]|uniref:hypothetical protein n=1 Tax=Enterobacter hormaechei TaxID=158836 RepID=UPI0023E35721
MKLFIIFVDDSNVPKRKTRSLSKIQVVSSKSRKRNWKEVKNFEIDPIWLHCLLLIEDFWMVDV